jgi:hypothetical protein
VLATLIRVRILSVGCVVFMSAQPAPAQVRDTTIRAIATQRFAATARLQPEFQLRRPSGPDDFASVANLVRHTDGTIWVVADGGTREVELRLYDARGLFVRSLSRFGRGPGESVNPSGLAQLPDGRVIMRDLELNRVSVYKPGGALDTTWALGQYSAPPRRDDALIVDVNGNILVPFSLPPKLPLDPRVQQNNVALLRVRPNGTIVDTIPPPRLPTVATDLLRIPTDGSRGSALFFLPYSPSELFRWGANGLVTSASPSYAFEVLPLPQPRRGSASRPGSQSQVLSFRASLNPLQVSDAERRDQATSLQASVLRATGSSPSLPSIARVKPHIKDIRIAADGSIWINRSVESERYEPEPRRLRNGELVPVLPWRETPVYDVFDTIGNLVGQIRLSHGLVPVTMTREWLWGLSTDENDGTRTLRFFRISWPT